MKIRIQGNSIRLRLSQSEVRRFVETGVVKDSIRFGVMPEASRFFSLEKADVPALNAAFADSQIKISIPANFAGEWASSDQISMEHEADLGNGERLKILVEKDFQCLTDRPGEDESDNFPNPNASC
ncbi:MAG: hypothetical protein AAB316_10450 [Bacteroidota bacterium]